MMYVCGPISLQRAMRPLRSMAPRSMAAAVLHLHSKRPAICVTCLLHLQISAVLFALPTYAGSLVTIGSLLLDPALNPLVSFTASLPAISAENYPGGNITLLSDLRLCIASAARLPSPEYVEVCCRKETYVHSTEGSVAGGSNKSIP